MSPGSPSAPQIGQGPASDPAKQAPLDMRQPGSAPAVAPAPQTAPPTGNSAPFSMGPRNAPAPATGAAPAKPPVAAGTPAARSVVRIERPIIPFETLRFEGETDARSWTFHLTQDEAASGTTLSMGYKNAVVVMPEASRLRIAINGESVLDTPVASSNDIKRVTSSIRPGLLRPGQNIIRM